jgi:hypothetical protein
MIAVVVPGRIAFRVFGPPRGGAPIRTLHCRPFGPASIESSAERFDGPVQPQRGLNGLHRAAHGKRFVTDGSRRKSQFAWE